MLNDEILNLTELSDNALCWWDDALSVAGMLFDDEVKLRYEIVRHMTCEQQNELSDAIDDETQRRADAKRNALVAHTIEQGEAKIDDGKDISNLQLMKYRAARLVKMIELNAPEPIIEHSFNLLVKMKV